MVKLAEETKNNGSKTCFAIFASCYLLRLLLKTPRQLHSPICNFSILYKMDQLMAGMPPGAAGQAAPKEPSDDGKLIDLTKTKLDASECYARNEASGFPMTNLFIGDTRLGCKSDTDEQLILHVAFNEFVKVHKPLCNESFGW